MRSAVRCTSLTFMSTHQRGARRNGAHALLYCVHVQTRKIVDCCPQDYLKDISRAARLDTLQAHTRSIRLLIASCMWFGPRTGTINRHTLCAHVRKQQSPRSSHVVLPVRGNVARIGLSMGMHDPTMICTIQHSESFCDSPRHPFQFSPAVVPPHCQAYPTDHKFRKICGMIHLDNTDQQHPNLWQSTPT